MKALRTIKVILALTIAAFAIAGAYMSYTITERQNALREVSRYNLVWAASQALTELQTFEHQVAAFAMPDGGVSKDKALLHFDIMYNRLNILRGGDLAGLSARNPEQRATVEELGAILAEIQPMMETLELPGTPERVLARLAPLEGKLTRFAAAANQFGGEQVAEDQQRLLELHRTFSLLASGLVVCGIAFIGLLFFQNRVVEMAHRDLRFVSDNLKVAKDAAEAANHDLRAMTETLRLAKEAAEEASDAKSRFLANMSHELRTPLTAIIGSAEIIANETFGPLGQPRYGKYAGNIITSASHVAELVNDILTMAKLDAGHYEVVLEPLALRHLVESTLGIFYGMEMAKDRDVAIEPNAEWWPRVRVDERAVRQILLNLLSNAVKFSARETAVRLSCRPTAEGDVQLSITDQGIGITPAEIERIGQPFYRGDGRRAGKYDGTGLGLSIVTGLMERHGGRLVIESQPGAGARMSIVFPKELIDATNPAVIKGAGQSHLSAARAVGGMRSAG